jgi:HEAT repeat protein
LIHISFARVFAAAVLLALLLAHLVSTARAQDNKSIELSPKFSGLMLELEDPNLDHRYQAAAALLKIQPLPPEAATALLQHAALDGSTLKAIGEAGSQLLPAATEGLKDPRDQLVRRGSVEALGVMAPHNPTLWPMIVGLLHNDDFIIRQQASSEFGNLSEAEQKIVVPLLLAALKNKDPRGRLAAEEAILQLGPMLGQATPELTALLKDDDPRVRSMAAVALSRISPSPTSAVPSLVDSLKDPVPMVRTSAAFALVNIDPHHREMVPILVDVLDPKDAYERSVIVSDLWKMGPDGQDAAPVLAHLLATDPDVQVRKGAVEALEKVDPKNAATPLSQALLHDKDLEVRTAALKSIGNLGEDGAAAIPALIESLRSENADIVSGATDDLQSLGKLATPPLIAALQNPDPLIRERAVKALANSRPLPDDVAKALTAAAKALTAAASKDKSRSVKNAAALALQGADIPAGDAALGKLEKDYEAAPQPVRTIDNNRQYSKEEIIATIPPDADNEYPLRLASLFPVEDTDFIVTLHQGQERPDRLAIWKKVGVNRYKIVQAMEAELEVDESFRQPTLFTPKGEPPGENVKFLDIVNVGRRFAEETVYAVDTNADELRPVDIPSPETWYRPQLHPGEDTVTGGNVFVDNQEPGFEFYLAHPKDPDCCPSGDLVVGTYKIVEDVQQSDDPRKPPTINWQFIPATAERKPKPPR